MADLNKVQQTIQSLNLPGVKKLNAKAAGNSVEITGQADSIAAKQAAMRALTEKFGDMGLVNKIEVAAAPQTAPQPQAAGTAPGVTTASEAKIHVVAKGETLSHIAQKYYGKASQYNKIFEANKDQIKDPDKIREGMKLRIP